MQKVMGLGVFLILGGIYFANPFAKERPPEVRILDRQAMFAQEFEGKFNDEYALEETNWAQYNAFRWAIAQLESGQNYRAVSPMNPNGQRAYGKYQVLAGNIRTWGGVSVEEFMNTPQIQERVFEQQSKICYQKYGSWDDCAAMWFSGRPMKNNNAKDVTGTSVPKYIQIVRGNMRIYMQKHGDAQSLPVLATGARIPDELTYQFPGLGPMATNALTEHCQLFGCPTGGINNEGATYPRTLPDGHRVIFKAEIHTNCKDGKRNNCPHTGMSSFVP